MNKRWISLAAAFFIAAQVFSVLGGSAAASQNGIITLVEPSLPYSPAQPGNAIGSEPYSIDGFADGLIPVTAGSPGANAGYMNAQGKIVIPAPAPSGRMDGFFEGLAAVKNSAGLYGFLDKTGKMAIPFQFADVSNFSDGLAWVQSEFGGSTRYIDKTGKTVIPARELIYPSQFSGGRAAVTNDTYSVGYMDKTGKVVIPCRYLQAHPFSEGLARVVDLNSRSGFIDPSGKAVVPCRYAAAGDFSEGLAPVMNDKNLWGFVDKTGKEVIPCQYPFYSGGPEQGFSGGLAAVMNRENRWGYIDKTGKVVIPFQYDDAGDFSGGYAPAAKYDDNHGLLYGYIDRAGNVAMEYQYAMAHEFSQGLAVVYGKKGDTIWTNGSDYGTYERGPMGIVADTAVWKNGSPAAPGSSFSDVAAGAYYADAVKWAVEKGITAGSAATTFSPDDTCTQSQILTFLWRAQGQPRPTIANPFLDVSENSYYYEAALWAYENYLISGPVFIAGAPCTRGQTVLYLWRLAGRPEAEAAAFEDVAQDAVYARAVAWAVEQGITSGTTAVAFSPDATCTRGQIATFLYRFMG